MFGHLCLLFSLVKEIGTKIFLEIFFSIKTMILIYKSKKKTKEKWNNNFKVLKRENGKVQGIKEREQLAQQFPRSRK